MIRFLKKLWAGKYGLPTTFWEFSVLVPLIFLIIKFGFEFEGVREQQTLFSLYYLLAQVYTFVAVKGLWTAGELYEGDVKWVFCTWLSMGFSVFWVLGGSSFFRGVPETVGLLRLDSTWQIVSFGVMGALAIALRDSHHSEESGPAHLDDFWEAELYDPKDGAANRDLWGRCYSSTFGNEQKIKLAYLRERVKQLNAAVSAVENHGGFFSNRFDEKTPIEGKRKDYSLAERDYDGDRAMGAWHRFDKGDWGVLLLLVFAVLFFLIKLMFLK